jgi:hypothetical protein
LGIGNYPHSSLSDAVDVAQERLDELLAIEALLAAAAVILCS